MFTRLFAPFKSFARILGRMSTMHPAVYTFTPARDEAGR